MEMVELRPLSLGELLDRTFTLYRRHFWTFVGIMAVPSAFAIPFNTAIFSLQGAQFAGAIPTAAQIVTFIALFLVFMIVFVAAYTLAHAAAAYAVGEAYLGRVFTVRNSYARVRSRFWPLIGMALNVLLRLMGIVLLGGVVLAGVIGGLTLALAATAGGSRILVGVVLALAALAGYVGIAVLYIWWALRYSVCIPVLILENSRPLASIRRSIVLTVGCRGKIFVSLLLASIITYVGAALFQWPFVIPGMIMAAREHRFPTWLAFLGGSFGAIGASITGPILMIVIVLCYYDARIRKEAFDLQFMMAALDAPAAAPQAAPTA